MTTTLLAVLSALQVPNTRGSSQNMMCNLPHPQDDQDQMGYPIFVAQLSVIYSKERNGHAYPLAVYRTLCLTSLEVAIRRCYVRFWAGRSVIEIMCDQFTGLRAMVKDRGVRRRQLGSRPVFPIRIGWIAGLGLLAHK